MTVDSAEERLQLAIKEVKSKRLGVNESARAFKIPASTLKLRLNGGRSRSEARVGKHLLSKEEEEALVERVLSMDSRGFPLTVKLVKQAADEILDARRMQPVGVRWASKFLRRIETRKVDWTRSIENKRALCSNTQALNEWFDLYSGLYSLYKMRDCDVYNMDETGLEVGMSQSNLVAISTESQTGVKIKASQREWATVIACVAGNGYSVPPMVLVRAKSIDTAWKDSAPDDWSINSSRKGWTDHMTALKWLKHFDHHTEARAGGRARLLILNEQGTYIKKAFNDYCENHRIILRCVPPHSSHLTQPLGVGILSSLKHFYALEADCEQHGGEKPFFKALVNAYSQAVSENNIETAFQRSGLIPFNREAVLSKIQICRTFSSSPEPEEGHLRTPQNHLDVDEHTTLVQSYTQGNGTSSPDFIEEACSLVERYFRSVDAARSRLLGEVGELRRRYLEEKRERAALMSEYEPVTARERALIAEIAHLRASIERTNQGMCHCGVYGSTDHNARMSDGSPRPEDISQADGTLSTLESDSSNDM